VAEAKDDAIEFSTRPGALAEQEGLVPAAATNGSALATAQ
jgi:hypothetical protein